VDVIASSRTFTGDSNDMENVFFNAVRSQFSQTFGQWQLSNQKLSNVTKFDYNRQVAKQQKYDQIENCD